MAQSGMKLEQQQLSFSQLLSEEIRKENYNLIDLEQIEGTPFVIIHNKEEKIWFAVMGDHALTPKLDNKEEVTKYIQDNQWLIITNVVLILIQRHQEFQKLINQEQTTPYETESL